MDYVILAIVCYILGGCTIGGLVAALCKKKAVGVLKIDRSTGEPYMFLELDTTVNEVSRMKEVTFVVDPTNLTRT
jgi:hypothetical protein